MLYSYNTYKQMVLDKLKNELGEAEAKETTVVKGNGIKIEGVQLNVRNRPISPIIYFDTTKNVYDDTDIEQFVKTATDAFETAKAVNIEKLKQINEWDYVKDIIRPKVLNWKKNEEKIKSSHWTYIRVMDLAVTVLIPMSDFIPELGSGSINVNDTMLKIWGVDKKFLFKLAMSNLEKSGYSLKDMSEVLRMTGAGEGENSEDEEFLNMLTVYDGVEGAAVILSKKILLEACEKMSCKKIFILPSSVNEVLLVDSTKGNVSKLQEVVREVNRNVLEENEFLSDEVYVFDREKKKLMIAKSEDSDYVEQNGFMCFGGIA